MRVEFEVTNHSRRTVITHEAQSISKRAFTWYRRKFLQSSWSGPAGTSMYHGCATHKTLLTQVAQVEITQGGHKFSKNLRLTSKS